MNQSDPYSSSSFKKRIDNNDEFISGYSKANNKEDFAESFEAYILIGNIFRIRAQNNIYLQQKYNFIKNNIFYGKEFQTGDMKSYALWNSRNIGIPSSPTGYITEDPNWTWDYNYSILSK